MTPFQKIRLIIGSDTIKKRNVIIPPVRIKSMTRYRAGPMIRELTWWVGIRNELDVEIATVIAKTAGFPPAANAIEIASGTNRTVAPILDMTKVKIVAKIASETGHGLQFIGGTINLL